MTEYEELRQNGFPDLRPPNTEGERAHQHLLWLRMKYGPPPHTRLYTWMERYTGRILTYGCISFWIVVPLISVWGQRRYGDRAMFFITLGGIAVYALAFALHCWLLAREDDENPARYGPSQGE